MEKRRKEKSKTVLLNSKSILTGNLNPTTKHSSNALKSLKTLKETHYLALESNLEFNEQMEDVGVQLPNFCHSSKKALYCIFDGHNGVACAKYASQHFPHIFEKLLNENPIQIENNLITAYKTLDEKCKNYDVLGCTATTVYIDNHELYCANVGDSSCMLVYKTKAEKISYDDKATDEKEMERMKKEGGFIEDERLDGILAISRAIGDYMLKKKGLTAIPHVVKKEITEDVKYCVIASDGVWDVVDETILFDLSKTVTSAKEYAEKIVKKAVSLDSEDNISCIVIKFE